MKRSAVVSGVVVAVVLACSVAHGAPSLFGPTGILFTPNAEVVGERSLDLGVHFVDIDGADVAAYKGTAGVCEGAEISGAYVTAENGVDEDEFLVSGKVQLVSGEENGVSVAVGGMDIFEELFSDAIWYVAATRTMGDPGEGDRVVQVTAGLAISRHIDMEDGDDAEFFASVAGELCDRATGVVEFFGDDISYGARVGVGDNFSVDVGSLEFYGEREFIIGGAYNLSF
jgi:hypothetical protein